MSYKGPYNSSFGGISAVNPQAQGDYSKYIDASFQNAKGRLDPMFQQNQKAFDQKMQNMGIPIGGDAYNDAMRQMGRNQSDAYSNAAFQSMGFGLGAQNQDFTQDAQRSQLANALLRAQWNDQTSRFNIGSNFQLGQDRLAEDSRQWDQGLGFKYDSMANDMYKFDNTLAENRYQFDSGQDFNYWDAQGDRDLKYWLGDNDMYQWGNEFERDVWNDQMGADQWSDALSKYFATPQDFNNPNVGSAFTGAQNANNNTYRNNYTASSNWWDALGGLAGDIFNNWPGKQQPPTGGSTLPPNSGPPTVPV